MRLKTTLKIILVIGCLSGLFHPEPSAAQRRGRPDSMKHTEKDVEEMRKVEIVNCKFISNGHTFYSDVYQVGGAGKMKIGTAILSFTNGYYKLKFNSVEVMVRDVLPPKERNRYNPWYSDKLGNDFTLEGKFETFKKLGNLYLRLYDGNSKNYITDFPLESPDSKEFSLFEDDLLLNFKLQ